jgi:hypothetical protein
LKKKFTAKPKKQGREDEALYRNLCAFVVKFSSLLTAWGVAEDQAEGDVDALRRGHIDRSAGLEPRAGPELLCLS